MRVAIGAISGAAVIGGCCYGMYAADCKRAAEALSYLRELSKTIPQTLETGERVTQLIAQAHQKIRTWEDLPLLHKVLTRLEVDHIIHEASDLITNETDENKENDDNNENNEDEKEWNERVKAERVKLTATPLTVGTATFSDAPDSDFAKRRAFFALTNSEE